MRYLIPSIALLTLLPACSEKARPAGTASDFDTGVIDRPDTSSPTTDTGAPPGDSATGDTGTTPMDGTTSTDTGPLPDGAASDTLGPHICPAGYTEKPGTAVGYSKSTGVDLLSAITWDELTMAWATTAGGKVTIHYADRTSRDGAFGTANTLPDSLGPFDDKVALSADGLTMLFVSADNLNLRQITRSSRTVAFDASTATNKPFENLIGKGGEGSDPAKKVSDIVLSKDGKMLWYTDMLKTSGSSLRVSFKMSDGTFDYPNVVDTARLQMEDGKRRRPTGISSDGRVLFFWDEAAESSFSAFRIGLSAEFGDFHAIAPNGKRAMPNDACDRFYVSLLTILDADARIDATQIFRVP